ncbi:FixH family protein [Bacillus sp. BGMRC 2118]|nr:FixH family protein [Bacillus sp. BGMRC 2118]
MKKIISILLLFVFTLLLTACSLNEDVENLYKQENPLVAEVIIPETFSEQNEETIQVFLTQKGEVVTNADFVHFEIWKQDGTLSYSMEEAKEDGNGSYSLSKRFDSDGLYFIKIHASNEGSIIMPVKQFIVGELTASDIDYLQSDVQPKETDSEHHH